MRQLDSILKKTKPLCWSEDFRLKCLNTLKWLKMTQKIPRNRFSEPRISHEARDISSADNAFFFQTGINHMQNFNAWFEMYNLPLTFLLLSDWCELFMSPFKNNSQSL